MKLTPEQTHEFMSAFCRALNKILLNAKSAYKRKKISKTDFYRNIHYTIDQNYSKSQACFEAENNLFEAFIAESMRKVLLQQTSQKTLHKVRCFGYKQNINGNDLDIIANF